MFGRGLIGSAIELRLSQLGFEAAAEIATSWHDLGQFKTHLQEARQYLARMDPDGNAEIQLIWAAGSGGFSCGWEQLAQERDSFSELLSWFLELGLKGAPAIHYISSAGGLFEGQVLVDEHSVPAPRRPYGKMKLLQESLLLEAVVGSRVRARIYRPSTVYGPHRYRQRAGLVSHMLWNAIYHLPTPLERNVHALRDYVHVSDVANFIAGIVSASGADTHRLFFLVSARPASILEVKNRIERILMRRVAVRLTAEAGNDADITFAPTLRPSRWRPLSLEQGLSWVYRDTLGAFRHNNPALLKTSDRDRMA